MLLPPFSGQQLLRKDINEKGSEERDVQGEIGGRGGGGCRAEVGGRALGLRSMFVCEMVCMFTMPAVWLWRGVFWGVGYVMGKSMTFCLIFEEVKHAGPPPDSLLPLHAHCSTKRPHRSTRVDLLCVSCSQAKLWCDCCEGDTWSDVRTLTETTRVVFWQIVVLLKLDARLADASCFCSSHL